jgi:hypothetical protein
MYFNLVTFILPYQTISLRREKSIIHRFLNHTTVNFPYFKIIQKAFLSGKKKIHFRNN